MTTTATAETKSAASPRLVLTLNSGSSSLKASVLNASILTSSSSSSSSSNNKDDEGETRWMTCLAERLGTEHASMHVTIHPHFTTENNTETHDFVKANWTHEDAVQYLLKLLQQDNVMQHVVAVGHRVVHGGTDFPTSVIVKDEQVLERIDANSHLAPLHNPHNVHGIRTTMRLCSSHNIPSVAVFDTSFHATLPPVAYTYPLPAEYRALQMRKFGFHGTSVMYITHVAQGILRNLPSPPRDDDQKKKNKDDFNLIVCHLGNGASITAVSNGQSQDTTMGFTPLAGIMMGTRCGSIDPSILPFACQSSSLNKTMDQVMDDLNKRSGLCGMTSDGTFDMRELLQRESDKDQEAALAVDMFVYRLGQGIAEMMVALPGPCDALIFTAGIGEHSPVIRQRAVRLLQRSLWPQLQLDEARNDHHGQDSQGIVSPDGVWPVILNIATDEESMIVRECIRLLDKKNSAAAAAADKDGDGNDGDK